MNILKALVLSILISTISFGSLKAQSDSSTTKTESDNYVPQSKHRPFRIGVYGGLGMSWLTPKLEGFYENKGAKFTYTYGFLFDNNFTNNYTFSTGLNFTSLGGKLQYDTTMIFNGTPEKGSLIRSYRVGFIEVPLLLKLKTNQMGYFTYFIQFGIRNSFQINSYANDVFTFGNATQETNNIDINGENEHDNNNDYNKTPNFYRLSLSFSLGAEYAISQSFSAFAYIGWDNGLNNGIDQKKNNSNSHKAKFNRLHLTAGFMF